MAEPITTTATGYAVATTGITALLIGWFGEIGADVIMVILSSIAGCSIALSGKSVGFKSALIFTLKGMLLSVVLAWGVSGFISSYFSINSPYLPSIVAFILGFLGDKIADILTYIIFEKGLSKIGVENDKLK